MAKANMSLKRNAMPTQDAFVRAHNFDEVALGYTEEQAIDEAMRCLECKNMPCVSGCPVKIHIPEFISKIKEGDFEAAYQIITKSSSLPAVCGRVCPQETQCESKCVRGIKGESVGIGRLERFVADWHNTFCTEEPTRPQSNGHRVAIVGSGPSGLTCAGDLAKKGYNVTVFEALHTAGGVLVYGIPEFRLPKAIVAKEVETLKKLGVKIETNVVIGKTLTVDELFEMGFEAVFIGSGAGLPNFMGIPGESLKGVYSANEFLTRSNLMKAYLENPETPVMKGGKVAVVGGGNSAAADALYLSRLVKKVYLVHRRDELRASKTYMESLEKTENIEFLWSSEVVEIEAQDYVTGVKVKSRKDDSIKAVSCDGVFVAIGNVPNTDLIKGQVELDEAGYVPADETTRTNIPGVFAVGDMRNKPLRQIVTAVADGAVASKYAEEYIDSM